MTRRYTRNEWEGLFDYVFGERLAGAPEQAVNELVTVPRYKIGSRLQIGLRVYHYAHVASAALGGEALIPSRAVANIKTQQERGPIGGLGGCIGAYPIGSKVITIQAIFDVLENEFEGGMLLYADEVTGLSCHVPILSNTAALSGNNFTIHLEYGIPVAMTNGYNTTCISNPFYRVSRATIAQNWHYLPIVGVPELPVPVDNYLWLQTWGPCMCVGTGPTGETADDRNMVWHDDGVLQDSLAAIGASKQFAGWLTEKTWYSEDGGAPAGHPFNVINLMLFP